MHRFAWVVLASIGLISLAHADSLEKELEKFRGRWKVELIAENGIAESDAETKKFEISIRGDIFYVKMDGREETMTFKIDPDKNPKCIDITPNYGDDKGKTAPGIYEFDGDYLRICACPKGKRPVKFATTKGTLVLMLKRMDKEP